MNAAAATASSIIKALDRLHYHSGLQALAELDSIHTEAVRSALSAVPRKSRIDVRLLIADVKRVVAQREASRPKADPFQYETTLLSDCELLCKIGVEIDERKRAALRAELAWRETQFGAVTADAHVDAEPDEENEPNEPLAKPSPLRRSIPRVPSKRIRPATDAQPPARAKERAPKPQPAYFAGPQLLGGPGDLARPLGCPADVVDFQSWRSPRLPSWVIQDDTADPGEREDVEDEIDA